MRRKIKQSLSMLMIISFSMIIIWACSNNSTGNNDNNGGGNTYYAENIQPIFNASCAGSSCHIPGPTSGVSLANYNNAINSKGVQYGTNIILPGNASGSPIIDKISSSNPKHGVRMPYGGSPLSQAKIDTLKAWINRGAKEDG